MPKLKTLDGIAKEHGRDAFLEAARNYFCHVRETVANTIHEMESRWYDSRSMISEAQKMLDGCNSENCVLSYPPSFATMDMGQGDRGIRM